MAAKQSVVSKYLGIKKGRKMGLIISTAMCIGLLVIFNVCGKKNGRLPAKAIIHLVLLGLAAASVITIFAFVATDWDVWLLSGLFGLSSSNFFYLFIDNFILTALVEEGLKYLVLRLYLRKKDLIKNTYQGLVAASAVAAGFVAAENVIYILGESGLVLRLTFGIFGHFVYAVFMGTDIVKARLTEDTSKKRMLYLRALFLPVLLHGVYDFALSVLELEFDVFLYIFVFLNAVAVFVFFYIIGTIKKIRAAVRELKAISGQAVPVTEKAETEKVVTENMDTEITEAEIVETTEG